MAGSPGTLGQSHMSGERPWSTKWRDWISRRVQVTGRKSSARWARSRNIEKVALARELSDG